MATPPGPKRRTRIRVKGDEASAVVPGVGKTDLTQIHPAQLEELLPAILAPTELPADKKHRGKAGKK